MSKTRILFEEGPNSFFGKKNLLSVGVLGCKHSRFEAVMLVSPSDQHKLHYNSTFFNNCGKKQINQEWPSVMLAKDKEDAVAGKKMKELAPQQPKKQKNHFH